MPERPNLFLLGAQKSGTSSLHDYLCRHPDISAPKLKEQHQFDSRQSARGDRKFLKRYAKLGGRYQVDSTPSYLCVPGAMERVAAWNPSARAIVVLRDPVRRAYSHYWHAVRHGWEDLDFESALLAEGARLRRSPQVWLWFSYRARGLYALYVAQALRVFGTSNVAIVPFEELAQSPDTVVRRLFEWLDVDTHVQVSGDYPVTNEAMLPRLRSLNRLAGKGDGWFGERNILSRSIRRLTLHPARYPPMAERTAHELGEWYAGPNAALGTLVGGQWWSSSTNCASPEIIPCDMDLGVHDAAWRATLDTERP